ncbi:coiled-coil domain-containing protein 13 isoform X5 [Meles meles]|uniref:coiled-coil domain-containing protein 13 isoform X5 n=1 Tax=Meles meles TaxID=9662 RepID=UPI001E69CD51|nr:coiled-coil domain-containing protein 13 isoform X5 [Meles meles]
MAADEGTQDTLRLQFKALQEMQHKRLQKQMEKQKEKELNLEIKVDDQKESFEISDGLSLLQAGEQNSKNSFEQRMLEDEVAHLREQLRETVDENGRLYKLLKERDFEIKHLKKKIEEDRFAFTGTAGVAGDAIATKIVELSKKNRVLTAESEGAKTRVKQLGNRVRELERELQAALTKLPATAATDAGTKASRAQMGDRALPETPEVKALQDRLAATNLKMSDLRNQIQSVKQELRMAQKVLISEVGEDVNVQQLLSSPGTWRGRAQQILVLQSKVRELEKQLGQTRSQSAGTPRDEPPVYPDPRKLSAQEKNLLRIRSLEREKQEGWEKLVAERDALQKELEELKKKLEGVRSRNKVLSSEVKTLRSQMGTLVEKGRHDDELIDALLDQLKQLQEILGSLSLQEEKTRASQRHLDQRVNSEVQQSSSLITQLRAMVAEREAKVQQLEVEIGQLSVQYLQNKGVGKGSGGTEVNTAYTKFLEDPGQTKSPASAGDHVGRLGSSRSVTSLGHTLVESALTWPSLSSPHGASPRFSDSPEQKGWQAQVTEFKALWQAAEVERDRLTEFVSVLQKRISRVEESNSKLLESEKKLQEERHRSVVLEQHLEKMRLEPGRTSVSQRAAPRSKTGHLRPWQEPFKQMVGTSPPESATQDMGIKTALPAAELGLYSLVLSGALAYAGRGLLEASQDGAHRKAFRESVRPGWEYIGRKMDVADFEWVMWFTSFRNIIVFALSGHVLFAKLCTMVAPQLRSWMYAVYGALAVLGTMGPWYLLLLLGHCVSLYLASLLGQPWLCLGLSLASLASFKLDPLISWQSGLVTGTFDLQEVLFHGGSGFTVLRCASFALESCAHPDRRYSLADLLKYNFYLPFFFFGPIMTFDRFHAQMSQVEPVRREGELWRIRAQAGLSVVAIMAVDIFFHFFYILTIPSDLKFASRLPDSALAGLAYSNLVYDWVKAAVLFGVVNTVARLDHLDPPQAPKCITALYAFAETHFDRGINDWLCKYVYDHIGGEHSEVIPELGATVATFAITTLWLGPCDIVYLWSFLNCFGLNFELWAQKLAEWGPLAQIEASLSEQMSRRIRALFGAVNFWAIIMYNLVSLNSLEFTELVARRLLLTGFPQTTLAVLFVTYCGVQLVKERERTLALEEEQMLDKEKPE